MATQTNDDAAAEAARNFEPPSALEQLMHGDDTPSYTVPTYSKPADCDCGDCIDAADAQRINDLMAERDQLRRALAAMTSNFSPHGESQMLAFWQAQDALKATKGGA